MESDFKTGENAAMCSWCEIPLASMGTIRPAVCTRCYKLLIGANLSDGEIFGVQKRQINSTFRASGTEANDRTVVISPKL